MLIFLSPALHSFMLLVNCLKGVGFTQYDNSMAGGSMSEETGALAASTNGSSLIHALLHH